MRRMDVLVVAATEAELGSGSGLVCGIGPVEAAAAVARALAVDPPEAVLHVGIAGGRSLAPGAVVLGAEARYCDLGAGIPVVSAIEPDAGLLAALVAALPGALCLPIGTSAALGGAPRDVSIEAMEGFGVLRACALAGVPGVELRVVSNEIGEDDRSRWDLPGALAVLDATRQRALAALGGAHGA
jgi:futalosine hydrolase